VYTAAASTGYDPPFGFGLSGSQVSLGGVTYTLASGSAVNIGDEINLSGTISVSTDPLRIGPSQQTVNGVTYGDVFLTGTLNFVATPATLLSNGTDAFNTPFTMNGSISLFHPDPLTAFRASEPFLTVPIGESGTASLSLFPRGDILTEGSVLYHFAATPASPTPEPATLTLLGGGLVIAVAARRAGRPPKIGHLRHGARPKPEHIQIARVRSGTLRVPTLAS